MTTTRAFFPQKLGHFFPIFEKWQGRPPPPPSSCAPEDIANLVTFPEDILNGKLYFLSNQSLLILMLACVINETENSYIFVN